MPPANKGMLATSQLTFLLLKAQKITPKKQKNNNQITNQKKPNSKMTKKKKKE